MSTRPTYDDLAESNERLVKERNDAMTRAMERTAKWLSEAEHVKRLRVALERAGSEKREQAERIAELEQAAALDPAVGAPVTQAMLDEARELAALDVAEARKSRSWLRAEILALTEFRSEGVREEARLQTALDQMHRTIALLQAGHTAQIEALIKAAGGAL